MFLAYNNSINMTNISKISNNGYNTDCYSNNSNCNFYNFSSIDIIFWSGTHKQEP